MFRIAPELSIQKVGFNIMLSSTVKKLDAFKFDRVAESDNTGRRGSAAMHKEPYLRSQNKIPFWGMLYLFWVLKRR